MRRTTLPPHLALLATGLALALGCANAERAEPARGARPAPDASVALAEAVRPAATGPSVPTRASTAPTSTAPTSTAPAPTAIGRAAPDAPPVAEGAPRLRRLVVARDILDREPADVVVDHTAGSGPLFAFAELTNRDGEATSVLVTFEREGGLSTRPFALAVPAHVQRHRTWARSRVLREPGRWAAVVRTADGAELGRASFELRPAP